MKSPLVIGKEQEGLYIFNSSQPVVSRKSPSSTSFPVSAANVFTSCSSFFDSNVKEKLWHYRLGHMPLSNMKKIFPVSIPCSKFSSPCIICPMERQSKLPFYTSNITTKVVFDLIHVDTWGPYNSITHDGFRNFLTIVDDFSRATWTHLLSTKSNAFPILKSFLSMVKRQFNSKVKVIRTDNAFELGNGHTNFFLSKGITHQTTCVYTPQ